MPRLGRYQPASSARRAFGRRIRRTLELLLAAVLVPGVGVGVLWPLTPLVGDGEQRIAARWATHGAKGPDLLPGPDKLGSPSSRPRTVASRPSTVWTLDQQLAKNLYTSDSLIAMVEQVELSLKPEASYTKSQILEMYLPEV